MGEFNNHYVTILCKTYSYITTVSWYNNGEVTSMGKAATRAQNKYISKNFDRMSFLVKKGRKTEIKARAESLGMSLNAYINGLIDKDMEAQG